MRIDSTNKPDGVRGRAAEGVREKSSTERVPSGADGKRGDSLELSRLASAVRSLSLRIVSDDTAVRAIRLQELKAAFQAGTFDPDPRQTADAMLDHVAD